MKYLNNAFLMSLLISSILVTSCSDDSGLELIISSPANNSTYQPGAVIDFVVKASDDVEVVSILVESSELAVNANNPIGGTMSVDFTFSVTLASDQAEGDYKIKFTVTDNDGNTEDQELKFKVAT